MNRHAEHGIDNVSQEQTQDAAVREEAYRRMNELLAELEMQRHESFFGRMSRSKSFWYGVVGTIFFAFMGAMLYWVYLDITG